MGRRCNIYKNIIQLYKDFGFTMDIRSDEDEFDIDKYYSFLENSGYIKKRTR